MRKLLLLLCILSITIGAKAQFWGKKYIKGAYYDLEGKRIPGLVYWFPPKGSHKGDDYIYYKPDKSSKEVKISTGTISAFITDRDDDGMIDSFNIARNTLFENKPVINVLSTKNQLKLFGSSISAVQSQPGGFASSVYTYIKTTYYYGPDIDHLTILDKKNFMEMMPQIMADKPEAINRIKNKKLRFSDIDDLLYFYKYDVMPPMNAPYREAFEGLKE